MLAQNWTSTENMPQNSQCTPHCNIAPVNKIRSRKFDKAFRQLLPVLGGWTMKQSGGVSGFRKSNTFSRCAAKYVLWAPLLSASPETDADSVTHSVTVAAFFAGLTRREPFPTRLLDSGSCEEPLEEPQKITSADSFSARYAEFPSCSEPELK